MWHPPRPLRASIIFLLEPVSTILAAFLGSEGPLAFMHTSLAKIVQIDLTRRFSSHSPEPSESKNGHITANIISEPARAVLSFWGSARTELLAPLPLPSGIWRISSGLWENDEAKKPKLTHIDNCCSIRVPPWAPWLHLTEITICPPKLDDFQGWRVG